MEGHTGDDTASLARRVLAAVVAGAVAILLAGAMLVEGHTSRGPIVIEGNNEFLPENGVIGGAGTLADPYRIEGWEIGAEGMGGISIANTDVHVLIRNVSIHTGGGIGLANVSHVRLENVSASGNAIGVFVSGSRDISIVQTRVTLNSYAGMLIDDSTNVTIEGSTVAENLWGITSGTADRIVISSSTIDGNLQNGIDFSRTTNATITGNVFVRNGISFHGDRVEHFLHTVAANEVNGLPLVYVRDCKDFRAEGISAGQVIAANCDTVRVANLTLAGLAGQYDSSIELLDVDTGSIESNSILDGGAGVWVERSSHIAVNENIIRGSWFGGVVALQSSDLVITRNHVSSATVGIVLSDVVDAQLSENIVVANTVGIRLVAGYHEAPPRRVSIRANVIATNRMGASLFGFNLSVDHNNFIENNEQAEGWEEASWDAGYPSGGNFWSNQEKTDRCRGVEQRDCSLPDGIVDNPYLVPGGPVDRYPLNETHASEMTVSVAWAMPSPQGIPPFTVGFTARPLGGVPPYRFHYDFGDGTTEDVPTPLHTYPKVGVYLARVTVTDARGDSANASILVTVEESVIGRYAVPLLGATAVGGGAIIVLIYWLKRRKGRLGPDSGSV